MSIPSLLPHHLPGERGHEGSNGPSTLAVDNIGGSGIKFTDKCYDRGTSYIDYAMGMDSQISIIEDDRAKGDLGALNLTVDRFNLLPSVGNSGRNDSMARLGYLEYTSKRMEKDK